MTRTRVTVSLPKQAVEAADREAERRSRSRSWVVAEALSVYSGEARETDPRPRGSRSGPAPSGEGGDEALDPSRSVQLEADLALTPEQRVLEGELTSRLARVREAPGPEHFLLSFRTFEDYLAWKDREAAGLR